MKYPVSLACLFLSFMLGSASARAEIEAKAAGYDAALARATAEHKDLVVFVHGTPDWDADGEPLRKQLFDDSAWRASLPKGTLPVVVAVPDFTSVRLPEDSRREMERLDLPLPPEPDPKGNSNGALDQSMIWNYPALLYLDETGRLIGMVEGLRINTLNPKRLIEQMKKFQQDRIQRDALLAKADGVKGVEQARLLGQALDTMPYNVAWNYRGIAKRIQIGDPQDETGYGMKYNRRLSYFGIQILELVQKKEYAQARAVIAANKAKPIWNLQQRQAIEIQRYVLCRNWPGHEAEAREALETAIKMGPDTDLAAGCKGLIEEMDGKTTAKPEDEADTGSKEDKE